MSTPDWVGAAVGFLLTMMIFSYVIGDNPLFRLAIHLFIGVAAGFAGAVALRNVILPQVILPAFQLFFQGPSPETLVGLAPLVLSALLLAKISRRLGALGNPAMAYLVGMGAAAAVGGAVLGTLFPQMGAAVAQFNFSGLGNLQETDRLFALLERPIVVIGTLCTLVYFQFSARAVGDDPPRRPPWIESLARIGQGFIAVTFGVLFAGVLAASLAAMIERVSAMWAFVLQLLSLTAGG